mgnify:CR=1 FL=1
MLALLDGLATEYGDDWWFGMAHAFAQCEAGQRETARKAIDRSMAAHPRNAHGAHVRAHVLYESGEDAAGRAYLDEWLRDYPAAAQLHCHLTWHVAIFSLGVGRPDRAWQAYSGGIAPGASCGSAGQHADRCRLVPLARRAGQRASRSTALVRGA